MTTENKSVSSHHGSQRSEEFKTQPPAVPATATNFEVLYDFFHEPLTDIISKEGGIIGINKKGELKKLEESEEIKAVEQELCKHVKARNSKMLDLRLTYFYNDYSGTMSDTMKYILSYYKVKFFFLVNVRNKR